MTKAVCFQGTVFQAVKGRSDIAPKKLDVQEFSLMLLLAAICVQLTFLRKPSEIVRTNSSWQPKDQQARGKPQHVSGDEIVYINKETSTTVCSRSCP